MAYLFSPYYLETDDMYYEPRGYAFLTPIACGVPVPTAQSLTRRASPVPAEVQPITGGSATQGYATGG